MDKLSFGTATPEDTEELATLCGECLGVGRDYFVARLRHDPAFLPDGRFVARAGSRIVATVQAIAFELVFGDARVPCGGIANVATDPGWRRRGLAGKLLDLAHARLASLGAPISILSTGIPAFYRPMGYATWTHPETHLLKLRPPTAAEPDPRVRRIDPARDLPALVGLRDRSAREFVGTVAPDPARWECQPAWTPRYPGDDPALGLVAVDGTDRPVAVIRATADAAHTWSKVLEFGAGPGTEESVRALARAYLAGAFVRGVRGLQYPAPCRDLASALTPFAEASVAVPADYLMLRIGHLAGFLRALAPDASSRTAQAGLLSGAVVIECGDQAALVRVEDARVAIGAAPRGGAHPRAALDPAQWVEVFGGGHPFSTRPFARSSSVGERDLVLLDTLFPRRHPVFWEIDAF